MKKILSILSLLSAAFLAPAQTDTNDAYAMLTDSNGVALSGQYFPASNIVGSLATILPQSVVFTNQFIPGTNSVATNAAAALAAYSNFVAAAIAPFQVNLLFPTTNVLVLGSPGYVTGSSWTAGGGILAGGVSNYISGSGASGLFAGMSNTLSSGLGGVILGGAQNTIGIVNGTGDGELGGLGNIVYDSVGSVILGGWYDTVGAAYGLRGVVYPPLGNTPANWSVAAGVAAWVTNNGCYVWADPEGTNNWFFSTGTNQYLIRASGGMGIGTNAPGTNQLAVAGNSDFYSFSVQGTNAFTLFSTAGLSNNLVALFNYGLTVTSNGLFAWAVTNYNNIVTLSNGLTSASNTVAGIATTSSNAAVAALTVVSNQAVTASNSLAASLTTVSNLVAATKAFTLTIPSGYASIGASLSAPFMPDGNYSVSVTPQDATTAGTLSAGGGEFYWDSAKANNGFTLNILFATNTDLHFDIIVHENTQ